MCQITHFAISQGHLVAVEEDQLPLAEVELGEIHLINKKTSDIYIYIIVLTSLIIF
jgi:hypothetical protein